MAYVIKTQCQMCHPGYAVCGLDVYVENGKIVQIKGMENHPASTGRLCPKGLAAQQLEYDPRRLKYPLKRAGERGEHKWQRISWDEALDTIATTLSGIKATHGPEAVAYHRGAGPGWQSNQAYVQRLMWVFGSPNYCTHGHLCNVSRVLAQSCTYGGYAYPDWENTKCMLVWGVDPVETNLVNAAARMIRAKERGAKLIVIDPRFTKTASKADIWVQPRPGSDGSLALGMLNVIIEEKLYDKEFVENWTTGFTKLVKLVQDYPPEKVEQMTWVPVNTIREVARMYALTKPAVIYEENGLEQHTNVVQTDRAVAILRSVTGNIDVPGSSILPYERSIPVAKMSLIDTSQEAIQREFSKSVAKHPLYFRFGNYHGTTSEVIHAIETGSPYPIKAMIVQGGDPLTSLSNQSRTREALKRLDFIAVHDIFMTAVAEIADIVLPAATFLERMLLVKCWLGAKPRVGEAYFALQNKAVEPLGECKSDADFIFELARRMGYTKEFPWRNIEEAIEEELRPTGITLDDLKRQPEGINYYDFNPQHRRDWYRKYEEFCSNLPNKKIELYSHIFEQWGYDPLPTYEEPAESPISRPDLAKDYPLICGTCVKPGLFTHTQYHTLPWLKEIMPESWVEINTHKAHELGISDGDTVLVESPRGSIEVKAKLTEGIHPRFVSVTRGGGQPYAHGLNENLITPDEEACPISGATGNRSFLCRITRVEKEKKNDKETTKGISS